MKLLIISLLTIAATAADTEEMISVPKSSAEYLVRENFRLRMELDSLMDEAAKMLKHIQRLQSSKNCS